MLIFLRQLLLHVSLSSPQNEGLCHLKREHAPLFPFQRRCHIHTTWGPAAAYPVQPDDHFVVVILVLLVGSLQGEVQVGPGDARDEEVHHGPQLQEGVVQGRVDEEQALLAEQKRRDDSGWAKNRSL